MDRAKAKRLAEKAWEDDVIPDEIHVYLAWWWLDGRVIPSQNQLFRLIEKRILGLVASYELMLEAAKQEPGVTAKVNYCLQTMRRLGMAEYVSWFHRPDSSRYFEGLAPGEWFSAAGYEHLGESLVHKRSKELSRVNKTDLPLDIPDSFGSINGDDPVQQALSVQRAFVELTAPDDWLRKALRTYDPREHKLSRSAQRGVMPIYTSLVVEAERLIKILSEATAKDDFSKCGHFSTAALLCLETLFRRGPTAFGQWYFSSQPEFGGVQPNAWFIHGGSNLLAALFQSFVPSVDTGNQWKFVSDSGAMVLESEPRTSTIRQKARTGGSAPPERV